MEAVGKVVPDWVFTVAQVMPYIATTMVIQFAILIVAYYVYRFRSYQAEHWYYSSAISFVMVVFLLAVRGGEWAISPFTGEISYRCFTGCRECF